MLPVKRRIKKQFLPIVLKQNKAFYSDFFVLRVHYRQLNQPEDRVLSQFTVTVTNKLIPHSVDRHLIKRRIHHLIQDLKGSIVPNLSLIVQIKKDPLKLPFLDLKEEIIKLFNQAKVLKPTK